MHNSVHAQIKTSKRSVKPLVQVRILPSPPAL